MPRTMSVTSTSKFAVGDHVLVRFGLTSTMSAEIIEDRGLIGHARRQYYRVRTTSPDMAELMSFEASADDLTRKPSPGPARA